MYLHVLTMQVSEGIDFSDDAARMCVIVGIPYPSSKDLQVRTAFAPCKQATRGPSAE